MDLEMNELSKEEMYLLINDVKRNGRLCGIDTLQVSGYLQNEQQYFLNSNF